MTDLIKLVVFIVVTAGLAWLSRSCLRDVRSHGFYRFFAWESILVLVLLNVDYWFDELFSTRQLISIALLTICTYYVIHSVILLHRKGKPDSSRKDPTLIGIEKTTQLVTVGVYRYVRHPIYGSLLFLAWGAFFKQPSWIGGGLALVATVFLTITAKVEELECVRFFGDDYKEYMKRTKMFIPFLF